MVRRASRAHLARIAKMGDGWMTNAYPPDQSALDVFGNCVT